MIQGNPSTNAFARKLRGEMSLPEVLLWRALRTRPGGFKFRRQHPAGRYVADFYCHRALLIVEVDGEAHNRGDNPEHDEARDAWFEDEGLRVFRVSAREVLSNLDGVVEAIVARATEQSSP